MHRFYSSLFALIIGMHGLLAWNTVNGQDLPLRYATLELFTNTPCPICGSQNPALFNRLQAFEGQYHLISFYPGKPYSSCIFYQSNISENTSRWQFYTGELFGTPTVAINGIDFKSSGGVTNAVIDAATGGESWLHVKVEETPGMNRTVDITLTDVAGSSLTTGKLFAVIVEKEVVYNAPNGETGHHNVFRQFLGPVAGEDVDLSSGTALKTYAYNVDADWAADQVYVIAWLIDPDTKEIYNSGTRFDPFLSTTHDITKKYTDVHAYPNPAKDQVLIELPDGMNGVINVKILSPSGSVVKNMQELPITSGPFIIPVNDMPSGLYYIIIDGKDRSYMGKVVVE